MLLYPLDFDPVLYCKKIDGYSIKFHLLIVTKNFMYASQQHNIPNHYVMWIVRFPKCAKHGRKGHQATKRLSQRLPQLEHRHVSSGPWGSGFLQSLWWKPCSAKQMTTRLFDWLFPFQSLFLIALYEFFSSSS